MELFVPKVYSILNFILFSYQTLQNFIIQKVVTLKYKIL